MSETGRSMTRREILGLAATAGVGLALPDMLAGRSSNVALEPQLVRKPIPSSGERVPVVGLGTASSFSRAAGDIGAHPRLRETLRKFGELGATVVDTAPNYGESEQVLGTILRDLGLSDAVFFATKIAGSGGREDGIAQARESMRRAHPGAVDLNQVHNLVDRRTRLPLLRELKEEGAVRYVGVTGYRDEQYGELEAVLRTENLDFVQVDYSIDNRSAEERILPLAGDRGVGVIANMPFGNGRLFQLVGDGTRPAWLDEFGAASWAQFFLRWIVSHPGVTVAIPATTNPTHLEDNVAAGRGRLPSPQERPEMAARFRAWVG